MKKATCLAWMWLAAVATASEAAEPTYWTDVQPVLRKHCVGCHSHQSLNDPDVSGGLALDELPVILKGGKTKVVKPGDGADSLLVRILRHPNASRRMPKDGPPLDDNTVAILRAWIDAGAKEGTRPSPTPASPTNARAVKKQDVTIAVRIPGAPPVDLALPCGPLPPVTALAYSSDGTLLATGCFGRVTVWNITTGKPVRALAAGLEAVHDLEFSADATLLLVAGGDSAVRGLVQIYSLSDGSLAGTLGEHRDVVSSVALSPDGKRVATASFDKTIRVWDFATRKLVHTLTGHSDFVHAITFSPDGKSVISASKDRSARITDAATGKSVFTLSGTDQDLLAVAVSPDGSKIVTSGLQPGIVWWNGKTAERIRSQGGHDIAVNELAFDRTGKKLASAGSDETIRVWDGSSGASLRVIPTGSVNFAVALRGDGKQVASGGSDGIARIWDASTGKLLVSLVSESAGWLAITPEGYVAAADSVRARASWRSKTKVNGAELWSSLLQPDRVGQLLRGERVADPMLPRPAK